MAYEIQSGPVPRGAKRVETRGRKSRYPIKDMQVGQWFVVPLNEEWQVRAAARFVRRKLGYRFQLQLDQTGHWWCLIRTA